MSGIATLPIENPVLIFFIVLVIILFAPILLNRIRVPHIIGLIIAGVIIGPNGLNLLARDSSFEIFGNVGILYLMFLAGLEIDMYDFKKSKKDGIIFGLYTFLIPMILGTAISYYTLHLNLMTSILLASMYASHTLIAYPIISRYGISRSRAVPITIAGTIFTVLGALIILAVISGMVRGDLTEFFWLRLSVNITIYSIAILYIYPRLTRWFFKTYNDNVTQFIFILALVFLASYMAQVIGLEAILGAFFAGIVLNRFIPNVSPLMNRLEFVGNALFIPYFLIGVGMLIDLRVIFKSTETIIVAVNMSVVATICKWLAAWLTQKTCQIQVQNLFSFLPNSFCPKSADPDRGNSKHKQTSQCFLQHIFLSFLRTFFCACRVCVKRADTNLAIEKFYFSIFIPPHTAVLCRTSRPRSQGNYNSSPVS